MPYKQADGSTKNGPAQYNSWMQLTQAQRDEITALEGIETGNPGKLERFAQIVHIANDLNLAVGDLTIGSVELKDGDSDTKVAVVEILGGHNAVATLIVDENGDHITTFATSSEAEQTPDAVANTKIVQMGGIAEETVPVEVSDGDAVAVWLDTFGRQIIHGSNLSVGAQDVNIVNQAILSRLGPVLNLDGATGAGEIGPAANIDVSNYHNITIHIQASGITAGSGTITVEHSLDGVNFVTLSTNHFITNDDVEIALSNVAYKYIRTNLTVWDLNGAYTSYIYAGN